MCVLLDSLNYPLSDCRRCPATHKSEVHPPPRPPRPPRPPPRFLEESTLTLARGEMRSHPAASCLACVCVCVSVTRGRPRPPRPQTRHPRTHAPSQPGLQGECSRGRKASLDRCPAPLGGVAPACAGYMSPHRTTLASQQPLPAHLPPRGAAGVAARRRS